MSTYYFQKPQADKPQRQSNGRIYYQRCNHIISRGEHQGERCNAETLHGSYACPDCKKLEAITEGFKLRDLRLVQY